MTAAALDLVGLHTVFGEYTAVDDVDMTVAPGSFHGLVGPNGAGKTTALSMAVGLLRPDAGRSLDPPTCAAASSPSSLCSARCRWP